MELRHWRWPIGMAAVGALVLAAVAPAQAGGHPSVRTAYQQINLVSDQPGVAQVTDPNLVNPWGMSFSPISPLWVSDNGTNKTTLYTGGVHGGAETVQPLVVHIPGGAPTGQVFNASPSDFIVHGSDGSSGPAVFIFVSEAGDLTGWNPNVPAANPPSTQAQIARVTPGAGYKGLAIGQTNDGPRLYAADFSAATVDVYNGKFQRVITPGNFVDPELPAGYAPFNVAVLDNRVYVAYAMQDAQKHDEIAGPGLGRVDIFSLDGTLMTRMAATSMLNAPWGLAIAPSGFGSYSGDLLVGNFGNGRIHAYNPVTLGRVGTLRDSTGHPIAIDGLWGLMPGNGVQSGKDEVIFTAGPADEAHGLLGTLSVAG